jgi:hypothetical protein
MNSENDFLTGLSESQLKAVAKSKLVSSAQSRLSALLRRNAKETLTGAEQTELDRMLEMIDQLNILKARAILTLENASDL